MNSLFKNSKRAIAAWCLYDWGQSAFPIIIITFIFATYFTRQVASSVITGTAQWGNAIALAGFFIAVLSPIFGAIADYGGQRKTWLGFFTIICIIFTALLWFVYPAPHSVYFALACIVLAFISVEIGLVFYNAMLPSLAPSDYLGRVSGWGWGLGYIGGLFALIIVLFGFVKTHPSWLNTTAAENIRISGPFVALWFAIFALPLFLFVKETITAPLSLRQSVSHGLSNLLLTLKKLPGQKSIFIYLIAHMIYVDGLNTIFAFGGIYAAGTFGMDMTDIIIFGIVMNLAAGIGAGLFAWVDDALGSKPTILITLVALTLLGLGVVLAPTKLWFWVFASTLCLFLGPVQSASRTLMARLVSKEHATEMFGLYSFSGKVTTFLSPLALSFATLHFHSQRAGMSTTLFFFLIGGLLLCFVREPRSNEQIK